jgi:DNA-directed RNA polymerase specialized sigma24 family protein
MEAMSRRQPIPKVCAALGFRSKIEYRKAAIEGNTSEVNDQVPAVVSTPTPLNSAGEGITQEEFDRLLGWFNADRQTAGEKYEWIRKRLIKIFVCRGSNIAEELADRTINRVIRKLPEIQPTYVGDPAHYFVAVAQKIWLESIKRKQAPAVGMPTLAPADDDGRYATLEKCLEQLTDEDRDLVLSYYQGEGQARIEHRKMLAARLGMGMNALRIKAYRIRSELEERIKRRMSD